MPTFQGRSSRGKATRNKKRGAASYYPVGGPSTAHGQGFTDGLPVGSPPSAMPCPCAKSASSPTAQPLGRTKFKLLILNRMLTPRPVRVNKIPGFVLQLAGDNRRRSVWARACLAGDGGLRRAVSTPRDMSPSTGLPSTPLRIYDRASKRHKAGRIMRPDSSRSLLSDDRPHKYVFSGRRWRAFCRRRFYDYGTGSGVLTVDLEMLWSKGLQDFDPSPIFLFSSFRLN